MSRLAVFHLSVTALEFLQRIGLRVIGRRLLVLAFGTDRRISIRQRVIPAIGAGFVFG